MTPSNATRLKGYYRAHATIYDGTRWSFLWGREQILRDIREACPSPRRILEVGCGTGRNLEKLCQNYPGASVTGLDLSQDMLRIARKKLSRFGGRVRWIETAYDSPVAETDPFDLILFSYSLSMFNPGWETAIAAATRDLTETGCLAAVDFDSTPLTWFRKWMGMNHVRMEGHLLPALDRACETRLSRISPAYLGCWRYFRFLGRKRS